jgi:hypothetical protein
MPPGCHGIVDDIPHAADQVITCLFAGLWRQ